MSPGSITKGVALCNAEAYFGPAVGIFAWTGGQVASMLCLNQWVYWSQAHTPTESEYFEVHTEVFWHISYYCSFFMKKPCSGSHVLLHSFIRSWMLYGAKASCALSQVNRDIKCVPPGLVYGLPEVVLSWTSKSHYGAEIFCRSVSWLCKVPSVGHAVLACNSRGRKWPYSMAVSAKGEVALYFAHLDWTQQEDSSSNRCLVFTTSHHRLLVVRRRMPWACGADGVDGERMVWK